MREFERKSNIDTALTVGELVEMDSVYIVDFIRNIVSRREMELGIRHGFELDCLGKEFHTTQNDDGTLNFPRSFETAIRFIHRANNNGGAEWLAAAEINALVDLIAERTCGVQATSSR